MTDDFAPASFWDDRYDRSDYLFGTRPAGFVEQQAHHIPDNARVLAVADGEGRNSVWLAKRGMDVTAMDNSQVGLGKARALAAQEGVRVEFQYADILSYAWAAESYDAVLGVYFQFLSPDDRPAVFHGFDAAVRPGGLLMIHGFAPRQVDYGTGGPGKVENMYTLDLLHDAFPGYEVLHEADYDAHVDSGEGHNGTAALIDFVARKPAA
ncbi:class I SAM-dependent methyltransferase [Psychromarinibacter sp. S121]|uniref:class I SAM-dependent methyltransferase n=1 Tax=Psychromarinibacter sp. S121 TaxID=3415127 RepID=UPI003C7BEA68